MKDMGIRTGSSYWAIPVIVASDTIYVHTDIIQVFDKNGQPIHDCFQYHEFQYDLKEFIEKIGIESIALDTAKIDTETAICDLSEEIHTRIIDIETALCELSEREV